MCSRPHACPESECLALRETLGVGCPLALPKFVDGPADGVVAELLNDPILII